MSTAKLFPDKSLTPDSIISTLFWFHSVAHFFHLQTSSYAEHKALDTLYKELVEFKDDISEKLLGYIGGRFGTLSTPSIPPYEKGASIKLCVAIDTFAKQLCDTAQKKEWNDISNIADSLSGLAVNTKYLLSLS